MSDTYPLSYRGSENCLQVVQAAQVMPNSEGGARSGATARPWPTSSAKGRASGAKRGSLTAKSLRSSLPGEAGGWTNLGERNSA